MRYIISMMRSGGRKGLAVFNIQLNHQSFFTLIMIIVVLRKITGSFEKHVNAKNVRVGKEVINNDISSCTPP